MNTGFSQRFISFVRDMYHEEGFIPLHVPRFTGNEKQYVNECIDSTFVSSVGKFVDDFEKACAAYCGVKFAVATVNGTAALHMALALKNIGPGDGVITQPVSFVATANAIAYTGATPVFVDVDKDLLSLSPEKLKSFLEKETLLRDGILCHKASGLKLRACVLMHTFGHPGDIEAIAALCEKYGLFMIEDAAESLGSFYKGRHTGSFGHVGTLSFNGNKIITTGGGGMMLFNDEALARRAKHITTTAKLQHPWDYAHDEIGYNYRMPNINAALGLAQLEGLPSFLEKKRRLAQAYQEFCAQQDIVFVVERGGMKSNYWLNALIFKDRDERDLFLKDTNEGKVMTRPLWKLLDRLVPYEKCPKGNLDNAIWLEDRVVNIPSSVPR